VGEHTIIKLLENMQRLRTLQHLESYGVKYLYFGCILLLLFTSLPVAAQSLDVVPILKLNGGYNDNILFNSTKQVDDFYTSVRPEIDLRLTSDRYNLGIQSYAEAFRYLEEKDLDYESYRYNFNGRYGLSQRLNISGDFGYIKDTTLDSELEESGRVVTREDRKRYQGNATLSYELDEVSEIDIEYQYSSTGYESNERIDRIANRVRLSYKRWFNDRLDQLTLQPAYTIADPEDNRDIEYYNFTVGWTHIFNNTLSMRNFIGYGQTNTKENGEKDSTRTGNADLSITHTGEVYLFRIGIRNNITLNSEGDLEEVDRFYCSMNRKLTERFSAMLYGGVYINRPPETYDTIDSIYYDIKPGLSYEINENHVLNVFYRYSYEEDRTVSENKNRTRNGIEFNIILQFPTKN